MTGGPTSGLFEFCFMAIASSAVDARPPPAPVALTATVNSFGHFVFSGPSILHEFQSRDKKPLGGDVVSLLSLVVGEIPTVYRHVSCAGT